MKKRFEPASDDVTKRIERLREAHYEDLHPVTIGALFVFAEDGESEQVLEHHGYPAAALCRIVPPRDRAAGLPDAMIIVDRYVWSDMSAKRKDALIDHELMHLQLQYDKHGNVKYDAQDRPKLKIRKHDRQFGWFDRIAERHGGNSIEVRQARELVDAVGQLYFDFGERHAA